jgi:CheY-like chemotaxis protein
VLVVDDEADARDLLHTVLSGVGAIVETASSALEGLALVHQFKPQIVVSDIGMPETDGYSFMERIRAGDASGRGIPSIALTAYTREQDRAKALAAGFTTHLGKPVNPHDLITAVANLAVFASR